MNDSILILANLAETAEPTARYAAALGLPLHLRLTLLHLEVYPVMLEPEMVSASAEQIVRIENETTADLRALARRLPGHPEVLESAGFMADEVTEVVRQQQPLLLAMDLSPAPTLLDRLLLNQMLPMLRATKQPLLLVPRNAPARLPRRVLLAVDDGPFVLNAASRALAPLLASWAATFTVAHVRAEQEQRGLALADVRASGLLPAAAPLELYEETHESAATGVLQAITDTQADLLVLIARPHSFLGDLFHHSVTASVLRHCTVPILLLPAEPLD
jgi:nucleotide-binding universal stress UspA family protein